MLNLETAAIAAQAAPHRHRTGHPRRRPRQGDDPARRGESGSPGPAAHRRVSRLRGLHPRAGPTGRSRSPCSACAASARSATTSPPPRRWTSSPAIGPLTPTAEKLRRLLHYGQIVQSHALHFFHLSSPDLLFGFESEVAKRNIVGVAAAFPDLAKQGVLTRKFGQEVIRHIAGKRIHGTGVIPGGVNKPLSVADRDSMRAGDRPDRRLVEGGGRARHPAARDEPRLLQELRRVARQHDGPRRRARRARLLSRRPCAPATPTAARSSIRSTTRPTRPCSRRT